MLSFSNRFDLFHHLARKRDGNYLTASHGNNL
jgi:hypothetical protein